MYLNFFFSEPCHFLAEAILLEKNVIGRDVRSIKLYRIVPLKEQRQKEKCEYFTWNI